MIIVHMMASAVMPALLPEAGVRYFEVRRPWRIRLYIAGELFMYKPAESIMKGVVGSTGMKIPTIPRIREAVPPDIRRIFLISFVPIPSCP